MQAQVKQILRHLLLYLALLNTNHACYVLLTASTMLRRQCKNIIHNNSLLADVP